LLQKERTGILRDALAELPSELREVLVLRELEELSYREIANIAQVPMGTVMSRLNRARKRLQRALIPANNEGNDFRETAAAR
jgi:RNA polymerase sigma-70 factor (ECF subfamily)